MVIRKALVLFTVGVTLSACSDIRLNISRTCDKYYLTSRLFTDDGVAVEASLDMYDPDTDTVAGFPTSQYALGANFTNAYYPIGPMPDRGLYLFGGRGTLSSPEMSLHTAPVYSNFTVGTYSTLVASLASIAEGGGTYASHGRFSQYGKAYFHDLDEDSDGRRDVIYEVDLDTGARSILSRWVTTAADYGWSGTALFTAEGETVFVTNCPDGLTPTTTCANFPLGTEGVRLWALNAARTSAVDFNAGDAVFPQIYNAGNGFTLLDLGDGTVAFSRALGRNSLAVFGQQNVHRGTIATGAVTNLTANTLGSLHKSLVGVMPRAQKILFTASATGEVDDAANRPVFYLMDYDGGNVTAVTGLDATRSYNVTLEDWSDRLFFSDLKHAISNPAPWTDTLKSYLVGSDGVAVEKFGLVGDTNLYSVSWVMPMKCY